MTCATDRSTRSESDRSLFPVDDDDDGVAPDDPADGSVSGISSARDIGLTSDGLLVLGPSGPMSSLGSAQ